MSARPCIPEAWRLIGPEMLACPSCKAYERTTVYGAYGSMVRICQKCSAHLWGCAACGNGPTEERHDGRRYCACGWSSHVPTAENPAPKFLPFKAPREPVQAPCVVEAVEVAPEPAPPVSPTPAPEPKKRAPTTRKPREQKAAPGQGSLF